MKKSTSTILFCMAVLLSIKTSAQIDSTFYYLDKSGLTNNVLCNFHDTVYWGRYDGMHDVQLENLFIMQILSDLNYYTFANNSIPDPDTILINAANEIRNNNQIPLLIIHYEYTRIKENALDDSLLIVDDGKYYDVIPRPEEPYETDVLFVAAPLKQKIYSGSQTFLISRDFFVSNLPDPETIEIDFDDGAGYREVSFGQSITVDYDNLNSKKIKIRWIYTGIYNTIVLITQAATDPEYCQPGYPAVDEFFSAVSQIPFNSSLPYTIQTSDGQWFNPQATGISHARIYVKYGAGHTLGQLVKPLIFIEGIDFGYESQFQGHPLNFQPDIIRNGDVGWCEFWGQSYDPTDPNNYLKGYLEFKHSPQFLNTMLAEGYDIMLVDFFDGADFIERNAMVIVELLNYVQYRQVNGGYSYQPSVIIGASMGGQIAKYALSYMEQNGIKHCTRNYISFDSPHQGANIPLSIQQWMHFFSYYGMDGGNLDVRKKYRKTMERPATKELLVRQYDTWGSLYRNDFVNAMNNLGYPKRLRKVAVANGSKFGNTQPFLNAGQQILDTDWSPFVCMYKNYTKGDCYTTGSSVSFEGRAFKNSALTCLGLGVTFSPPVCVGCATSSKFDNIINYDQVNNTPLWDNAPGGSRNSAQTIAYEYNKKVTQYYGLVGGTATANPTGQLNTPRECFIPTISALDVYTTNLTTDISTYILDANKPAPTKYPFDAYYASATNQPHVQLEDIGLGVNSNIVWSLDEIRNSEPNLPAVLDANSPNAGVFNMARHANSILGSVIVGNGGSLYFNADLPSDFGAATVPYPIGGTPPPIHGSTLNVVTCDCAGVVIDVQNGGQFIIGDNSTNNKAIVSIGNGANFYLRDGAILKIQDGSKLIIEEGANFYWENGAQIILEGADAILEIKSTSFVLDLISGDNFYIERGNAFLGGGVIIRSGTITMNTGSLIRTQGYMVSGSNSTFNYNENATIDCEFDQSFVQFEGVLNIGADAEFTFSGTGHFKFGLPTPGDWTNIHTGDNATILFEGSGPTDDIVFVFKDTWISNPPAPFTIRNGRVSLGNKAYISIGGDVELNNIEVTLLPDPNNPWHRHHGIYVHGQPKHTINNININNGVTGLTARNWYGGAAITIENSIFQNNMTGVEVRDKGLRFQNCTFINNGGSGWDAWNMAFNSTAINCNTSNNGMGSSFTTTGSANLILDNCTANDNDLYGAAFTGNNSFIVKCGSYSHNFDFGLIASNNADLLLYPLLGRDAGKASINYNSFSNILLGAHTYSTVVNTTFAHSLHLERGYNQLIRDLTGGEYNFPGYQLFGRVKQCLLIDNNQWEPSIPGNISNYDLYYEQNHDCCFHPPTGCPITDLTDNDPKWHLLCYEISDPPSDERSFIEYCPDCPIIKGEYVEEALYNEAFLTALNTTTEFDEENGDDLLAFNMFYEITQFGFYYDMVEVKKIQSLSYNRMKNLFATLGENNPAIFTPGSEQLERCLYIAERFITFGREYDDDILEYHSYLDMANFHYMSGSRSNAIEYILQIPGCVELDSNLYAFANHQLCFYYAVEEILTGREHVMKFDSLIDRDCFSGFRTGIGLASANVDTVIYSVNPISSPASITDNIGNTYLATTVTDSSDNFAIVKTLSNHSQDWQFTLDGWNMGIDSAKVITADAAGYVYAAGKAWNGFEFNLITAKINFDGEPVWTAFYNFPGMDATPVGISVDSNFIVSVYTHIGDSSISDYALIKYSQCDTSCVARMGNVFENVNLNNPIATEEFSIYPNPANDVLTIQYSTSLNRTEFQLIDITGRIVIREQLNSKEDSKKINISFLPSGIYSAIIVSGDKIQQVNKLAIVR